MLNMYYYIILVFFYLSDRYNIRTQKHKIVVI